MCYETASTKMKEIMEEYARAEFAIPLEYEPFYQRSAFAYKNLQIITQKRQDLIYPATWGFVPQWGINDIDGFRKKYTTFNAKSETVLSSGMYKDSARNKRCIILADGFFEPHHTSEGVQAYFNYIPTKNYNDGRDLFSYAGIYSEIAEEAYSCTILTTNANPLFEFVHNKKKRMPLVIDDDLIDEWLNPNLNDKNIKELMKHCFTSKEFASYPITKEYYKKRGDMNNPKVLEPKGEVITKDNIPK